jgi:hypothetical protein
MGGLGFLRKLALEQATQSPKILFFSTLNFLHSVEKEIDDLLLGTFKLHPNGLAIFFSR